MLKIPIVVETFDGAEFAELHGLKNDPMGEYDFWVEGGFLYVRDGIELMEE